VSACHFNRERHSVLACGFTLLLLCCCASLAAPLPGPSPAAQNNAAAKDYALIIGTVWGPDDRPVAGIAVTIRRESDKKPKWELVSDRRGEFAQRVPVGKMDYIIQADIKVPKGQPKPEITVAIEDNERKDVGLHLTEQQLTKK
jgi:hypothetical protein